MVGIKDSSKEEAIKNFLNSFEIIKIDNQVADLAIVARKKYKLKIPDALILASAQASSAILVSRNTKDFSQEIPIVRIPYELFF